MIRLKQFFTPEPRPALAQLAQQTHAIQAAVAKSLVSQGYEHVQGKTRNLEVMLERPVSPAVQLAPQEKGHGLQAEIHRTRLGGAREAFDQQSRELLAKQKNVQPSLHALNQYQEQLTTRVEQRSTLQNRYAAWSAATPPASSTLDPIPVPALPPAPLDKRLPARAQEQAVKHINASDKEIALLDSHIRQQPQPISQEEEGILFRQRNAVTHYRNAWATGLLQGTSQFKSSIGLSPERKHLEQSLERHRQQTPVELALHRLDRTVETAHRNGLGEKLSPDAVNAARNALVNLRDAWSKGSLDGSSSNGMNPAWVMTSSNQQRINLELAAIEKAFVQLNAIPRTEQANSAQDRLDFNNLIHSSAGTHVKQAAINQRKNDNQHRAQVAELNTDLRNIYTELTNNLALSQMTKPPQ